MATNIFSPWSGKTYSYNYGSSLGGGNSAYNIWGSQSNNPYIIFGPTYQPGYYNPNTGQQIVQPQPLQVSTGGGDSSFPDTTPPTGSGYSFGGNGSNSWFGGGVAGPSTSPGYSGPYDQGNPLATGNQGFFNELGKSVNDYFSSGGILGMAANAIGGLFGEPAANNDYNAKSYAQEVGVAEGAGPKTFSNVSVAQQLTDAKEAEKQAAQAAAQAAAAANAAAGNAAPTGSVTMADGSTVSSLSDMAAGTSGSYSSANSGDVGVTSYGDGQYGFTDVGGYEVGYEDPGGETGGGDSGGGGGSYIATATTQALGKEGLKVFEDWRDYMFNALPTFTSSFGRYRVTAPKIVEEIDKKENSKEIYKGIWDKYLKPIFDIIKTDKDSKKALKDYKVMVRELSNKYLKVGKE